MYNGEGNKTVIGWVMAMRKSYRKMSSVLAMLLAGAVLLNNGGVSSVFAAGSEISGNGISRPLESVSPLAASVEAGNVPAGDGEISNSNERTESAVPEGGTSGEQQPGGNGSAGESQPGNDGAPGGEENSGNDGSFGEGNPGTGGTTEEGNPGNDGTPGNGNPGTGGATEEGNPGNDGTSGNGKPGTDGTPEEGNPGNDGTPGDGNSGTGGATEEGNPGNDGTSGNGKPGADGTPGEGNLGNDGTPGKPGNDGTPGNGNIGTDGTTEEGNPGTDGTPEEDGTDGEGKPEADGTTEEDEEKPDGEEIIDDADKTDTENNEEGAEESTSCIEDREHEYEEILSEDGIVTGYQCVFCQREIEEDIFESEGAALHVHTWNRAEGEIVPVCQTCYMQRLDCDGEDGYGIHIFVLMQEEGQPDKYYCAVCGMEKEILDEWDMTAELFYEIMGISILANSFSYGNEQSPLPTTILDLEAAQQQGQYQDKVFPVSNLADVMALYQLSQDGFDFKEYTVGFLMRSYVGDGGVVSSSNEWDLTPLKNDFKGLGTLNAPFRGTLTTYYTGGSLTFKTATPFLNYAATGATVSELQVSASIDNGDGDPVGAIAAHVVKDNGSDKIEVSNVSISGAIKNSGGAAGILFGEVVNDGSDGAPVQIQYINRGSSDEKEDIRLRASVEAQYAGGLVGKTDGLVEVHQTNVFPTGAITGSVYGGMLAGYLGTAGVLVIEGAENGLDVKVNGSGINGGLIGGIENGTIRQEGGKPITITGTVEGTTAGGLAGKCTDTAIGLENLTIEAGVTGSGEAGGVIGNYTGNGIQAVGDLDWCQLHHIKVSGNITGGSNAGGVAGLAQGSHFRIGKPQEASSFECIQVSGTVSAAGAAGGIIGTAKGEYIEVYHGAVSGSVADAAAIGGIIGRVGDNAAGGRSVVKVTSAMVSAGLNPGGSNKIQGGIFGEVCMDSMAAMDGEIQVDGLAIADSTPNKGFIAGKQEEALVYFEEGCSYTKPDTAGKDWVDDIGSYGGVYRNGGWGESDAFISYTDKEVKGNVPGGGSSWTLDTEADVMRLAIVLNTQGRFGANCFGNTGKGALLSARYTLAPADGSFDLEGSGIYCLNRNDKGKDGAECFSGQLIGQGKTVFRLGNCTTYQSYLSLFPYAGNGAAFENITVDRGIQYAKNGAAGLAVYGSGNVAIRNVDVEMNLTSSQDASRYYYGGMFADYSAAKGTRLEISGSRIGGSFHIEQNGAGENQKHYAGGLIAVYQEDGGSGSGLPVIKIDGLELAEKIATNSRFASGMITYINNQNTNRDRVALAMDGIHIEDGARLEINSGWGTSGFLGWGWYDIVPYKDVVTQESYSIKNLRVGNGTTAKDGPYFSTKGGFGGMVYVVTGRIQMKDTDILNATFTASGGGPNGLLFNDGRNALIELEGYRIAGEEVGQKKKSYPATSGKVEVTGAGGNFSDIVGKNNGDANNYKVGGIVNIISKGFEDDFITFENNAWGNGSGNTRYYYNLFGNSLDGEDAYLAGRQLDGGDMVITDADQIMVWHLSQYMDDSIRRFLSPYFVSGTAPAKNGNVVIQGMIDLKGKSYYPTPVENCTITGGKKAEIKFYGDRIQEGSNKRARDTREHYLIQSGLLLSESGVVTVQGDETDYLTLSGKASHVDTASGALFSRTIGGVKNIYRIRLDNLFIYDYRGALHGVGLLVGNITDNTTVDISWVETVNYQKVNGVYAGSALIGQVGTMRNGAMSTENLILDFTNINVGSGKNEGIFCAATLIDKHYYTDNTEKNRGRVWYLFTEEAYKGGNGTGTTREPFVDDIHGRNVYPLPYVTVGKELEQGIEYWNVDGEADLGIADWSGYLPYVCEGKGIRVNPKNASITEGCGTYEDPYQITSAKQLLALSRYLINGDKVRDLDGWQIRAVGDIVDIDSNGACDKGHGTAGLKTYKYGNLTDFPSRDDLRRAYYVIKDDIDFTGLSGATDRNAAIEFVGLGTDTYPFAGVIVGEKADGTRPTVILPYKKNNNSCANFGLVQYAKGAVVKDLEVVSRESVEPGYPDRSVTVITHVADMGGTVMACILGGDNIIDNVKTGSRIAIDGSNTAVGGYVGVVEQGSLILRHLEEEDLEGFRCGIWNTGNNGTMTEFGGSFSPSVYPYVSGAVGKVENGFVIYEGSDGDNEILPHEKKDIAGIYRHTALPFSNTYDVIRAERMAGEDINITWSSAGNFDCTVHTAAQLQLLSMAINSDGFSICGGYDAQGKDFGGYGEKAVCRKAEYNQVGRGNQCVGNPDYEKATQKDDNIYWYPYIYQYFKFGGITAEGSSQMGGTGFYQTLNTLNGQYKSRLNAVTSDIADTMTYHLVDAPGKGIEEADYDLSVYKRGFRGLGATYRIVSIDDSKKQYGVLKIKENGIYSDFRANFDGAGATVKAEMINDYAKDIHTAALFNDLLCTQERPVDYYIKDLAVTGIYHSSDYTDNNDVNYAVDRAAAVVGMMRRPWEMENITVLDADISSKGYGAGIVAWIAPGIKQNPDYHFSECQVLAKTKETVIRTKGGSCGGIIGVMALNVDETSRFQLVLNQCKVLGNDALNRVRIENEGNTAGIPGNTNNVNQERNARGRSGALIGHVGKRYDGNGNVRIGMDVAITGSGSGADVQYVTVDGADSTGGIIGEYYGCRKDENSPNVAIENVTVSDCILESKNMNATDYGGFGIGGIIGKLQREAKCDIAGTKVLNTDVRSTYGLETVDAGITAEQDKAPDGDVNAGGIIGYCYRDSRITINRVQVKGDLSNGGPQYEISSRLSYAGGIIGASLEGVPNLGYVEGHVSSVVIEDTEVSGMNIISDSRTRQDKEDDRASGNALKAAGGIIGQATMMNVNCKDMKVENCVIRSGKGSAGGVIGEAFHQNESKVETTLEGVEINQCEIGTNGSIAQISAGAGSGGVFGRLNASEDRGSQKLKTVNVTESVIYGQNVGGIAGLIEDGQQIGNIWSDKKQYPIKITGNKMLGYRAGGMFGLDKSKKICFDSVEVEDNIILAARTDMDDSCAGGICGRKEARTTENNTNGITIRNNRIYSNNSNPAYQNAGGAFGYFDFQAETAEVYAYQTVIEGNDIGYYDMTGSVPAMGTLLADSSMTGQMQKIKDALTKAGTGKGKLWNGTGFTDTFLMLSEINIGDYAGYFGNLVGGYRGDGQAYFLMPTVKAPTMGIRPVVDVGTTLSGSEGDKLLSHPYEYRKNIHVVYQDKDTTPGNTAAQYWGSSAADKERLFSQVNAQKVWEEYESAVSSGDADRLLDAYRLHITDNTGNTVGDMYHNTYRNKENKYVSQLQVQQGAGKKAPLPLVVLDTQYGTVDQMMSSIFALLTGAGGVHNSGNDGKDHVYDEGIGRIMDMSVTPMKVENGSIMANTNGTGSVICKRKNDRWEISYDEFDRMETDSDGNPTGDGTFSLLEVTYRQKDYGTIDGKTVDGEAVVLRIPVFVVERLTIDTYLKIVEGEVYNGDKAKANGISKEPLLANDSSYTLYMEYIYGSARERYSSDQKPLAISKTLSMTRKREDSGNTGDVQNVSFWPGTRLTLIDVCNSDKVYYYTVDGTEEIIKYELFKDSEGNAYQNKAIHMGEDDGLEVYEDENVFVTDGDEYRNVAVEKFLIVVDTSLVDEEIKLDARDISDYHITPILGSEEIMSRTNISEHTELQVTRQPGLTIRLEQEENPPYIEGAIQDGQEVSINGTFLVSGDLAYWTRVLYSPSTTIDSANHHKYLEMGIYLTDTNGNRVKLPDNTNISVNGNRLKPWQEEIKPETNLGSYVNRNEMYFYRDGNIRFPLDALKEIIREEMDKTYGRTNGKISDNVNIVLNFGNADLTDYAEDRYVVHLELLRIEDADYPAGGEVIDAYTDIVRARRKTDLACALETKDLMELGINTYQNQTPMPHTIQFDFKLDFNGIISNNASTNQQIADKYYTVTYHIMEKANRNGTPVYEPYIGNQLSLELVSPPSADSQQTLQKGISSVGTFANSVYVTYKFNWNEIDKGTKDAGHGVITRDLLLTVKDGAKMDLSNYKVLASVMVSDTPPGDIEQDVNEALSDFFVFTIAKLKTDLDY